VIGVNFQIPESIIDRKEIVDIYQKNETSIDWDWDSVGTTLILHAFPQLLFCCARDLDR